MTATIFAQASAKGKCGVSIFRISGSDAKICLSHLGVEIDNISPRFSYLHELKSKKYNCVIDKALVIHFESPNSFTGEDVVELHTHGSIAVAKIIIEELGSIKGFRIAEPGEFSKRAFLNGKMDLTSAEGLADLIDSETLLQHNQAIKQFKGELYNKYQEWRSILISSIALLEACIDFPDEEVPEYVIEDVSRSIDLLKSEMKLALHDPRRGERMRSGISLAIIGEPNVGKSSLINYITQRDVSIVSSIAGTTRDIVESYVDIAGYPIVISDTAGINLETNDLIESEGIKRAIERAKSSDIKILLYDVNNVYKKNEVINQIVDENTIIVVNKTDLKNDSDCSNKDMIFVSVKSGIGMRDLLKAIENKAESLTVPNEIPMITRIRHKNQIEIALEKLSNCDKIEDLVLLCEEIRCASRDLCILTGKIEVDEILGEIFGKFCIGK